MERNPSEKAITYKGKYGTILKPRKQMSKWEEEAERQKIFEQLEIMQSDPTKLKPLFCTPNCQSPICEYYGHNFQNDYTKSRKDPRAERPGICFLEGLDNAPKNANTANLDDAHPSKGLGAKQTPIDLKTNMEVNTGFTDDVFNFNYENTDPKGDLKFNEQGDAFYYQLNAQHPTEATKESYMETQTISLFDKHIPKAKLYGAQYHFHSPSEHSVDGKLLDLEMHIVHVLESSLTNGDKPSQFSHGVLGFIFKVVPESFFDGVKQMGLSIDVEYHDRFLSGIADFEAENLKLGRRRQNDLDLKKFVETLEYNRRWTYPGSLTTIPCSEGILWNVIEQIIPIRQSTMDKYNTFRKIEEAQVTNKGQFDPWLAEAKAKEYPINGNSVVKDGNKFMRIAVCNRKVVEGNGRPVYLIDKPRAGVKVGSQVTAKAFQANQNQYQFTFVVNAPLSNADKILNALKDVGTIEMMNMAQLQDGATMGKYVKTPASIMNARTASTQKEYSPMGLEESPFRLNAD